MKLQLASRVICAFIGAVLIRFSVQSAVRSDTIPVKEYLDGTSRHTDIDFSLDVFVGNGVIHFIHGDVVIQRDCGNFPC